MVTPTILLTMSRSATLTITLIVLIPRILSFPTHSPPHSNSHFLTLTPALYPPLFMRRRCATPSHKRTTCSDDDEKTGAWVMSVEAIGVLMHDYTSGYVMCVHMPSFLRLTCTERVCSGTGICLSWSAKTTFSHNTRSVSNCKRS